MPGWACDKVIKISDRVVVLFQNRHDSHAGHHADPRYMDNFLGRRSFFLPGTIINSGP